MNAAAVVLAVLALVRPAATQQSDDAAGRCAALVQAQRDGRLDVPTALAALGDADDEVARTAAALLRHCWPELPAALLDALADRPAAARWLLHELAVAPRPSLSDWVRRWANARLGRTADDRCLALAARGTPPTAAEAEVLVAVLADGGEADGFRAAAAVLPPAVADALLGRLHAALQRGAVDVDRAGPLLDRLSPTGVRALLGLIETLPAPITAPLAARVHDRQPELLRQRVAQALDDAAPLAPCWLPWCAPVLDRPARQARVEALLGADEETADAAFGALLGARVIGSALLDFAAADAVGRPARLRRLLDRAIDQVPAARLVDWLQADVETSKLVVAALPRRARLEPELEQLLLARLQEAGTAEGAFLRPAALALAQRGGAGAAQGLWPWLRASRDWPELLDAFARRREPFVPELLLSELAAPPPAQPGAEHDLWLDGVALALVAAGDRRELHRLVARAGRSSPSFVRRCAHHARPLPAALALPLVDEALAVGDGDLAVELLAWAATAAADARVLTRLHALWREPPAVAFAGELQEVALRALVAGEPRGELVAALRAALRSGPVPPRLEPLAFELLGTMPVPLRPEDLELCAELVLLAPRTDPDREAERARRWPDGGAGFPLVAAVGQRLRTAEPAAVAGAFAAATTAALADPAHRAIAPQRLLVLLRTLAAAPAVQHAVGEALAPLLLARAAATGVGDGIAHVYAASAAATNGEPVAAGQHAAAARDLLLAMPGQRLFARLVLGERDPGAGVDPWAALAALPHLHAFRAAVAAGDHGAARRAAALVREFAGRDDRIPTEAALAAELR